MAYVYSNSGPKTGFFIYINGVGVIAVTDDNDNPGNLGGYNPTLNNICIGRRGDTISSGYCYSGWLYHIGIYNIAKYQNNFTPNQDLTPSNYTNVLFFLGPNFMDLKNNVQLLQDPNNSTNITMESYNNLMTTPNIIINPLTPNYILINTTYTDPGAYIQYASALIPYITSITNASGTQVLPSSLNALNNNIFNQSVIDTSSQTTYIITYSLTYNNITYTATRTLNIINPI